MLRRRALPCMGRWGSTTSKFLKFFSGPKSLFTKFWSSAVRDQKSAKQCAKRIAPSKQRKGLGLCSAKGWVVGAQRPNTHANTRTHLHTNALCASQRSNTTPSRCAALCKQSSHAHASLPIRLGNTLPSYTEHPTQHPAQRVRVSCRVPRSPSFL